MRVELDIFSGRPNPVWELAELEASDLETRIGRATPSHGTVALPGLGYRGFILHRPNPIRVYRGQIVNGHPGARLLATDAIDLEFWLLESGKGHLDRIVYDTCLDAIRRP